MTRLETQLAQLDAQQIIRQVKTAELEYMFKHTLTQETIYQSLLKKARRDIHAVVAQMFENEYADRLDEFAVLLARHYAEAGDDAKTLEYASRAGNASARVSANAEAVAHYSIAIDAARRTSTLRESLRDKPERSMESNELRDDSRSLPSEAGEGAILRDLHVKRGRALELLGRYQDASASYADMESLARERNDDALELASLVARATLFSTHTPLYDLNRALDFSDRALALARQIGDRLTEAKILWTQMLRHIYGSGDNWAGAECGEASLKSLRELSTQPAFAQDRAVGEQLAYTLNDLLYAYIQTGRLDLGLAARQEARDLWRELDNKPMLADNLAGVALAQLTFGDAEQAIATANKAFHVAESVENPWSMAQGRAMRGYALLELGKFSEALQSLQQGDEYATAAETGGAMLAARCGLATYYGELGMVERGLEHGQRALNGARRYIPDWHLWPHAALIRLHIARGDLAAARRIADECQIESPQRKLFKAFMPGVATVILADAELALGENEYGRVLTIADDALAYFQGSCPNYLPDLYLARAQANLGQGKLDEAASELQLALAATEKTRRVRWKVLGAATQVERARGNEREVDRFRDEARAEAQFIAQNLDAEMRAVFLNLASVR